jgi:hypothetical protein
MGDDGEVGFVFPHLVLVDLTDVVVADDGGESFGELDLGDVLARA